MNTNEPVIEESLSNCEEEPCDYKRNCKEENSDSKRNCEEEHFQSYLIEKSIYSTRIYLPIDMIRYVYSFLGAKTLDEYKDNILALRLEYIEQQETYRKKY